MEIPTDYEFMKNKNVTFNSKSIRSTKPKILISKWDIFSSIHSNAFHVDYFHF